MSLSAMIWAFKVRTDSPTRKLVLLKLADNANDQGEAFPSIPTIARQCEISEREVIRTIHELEQMGLVRVERQAGKRNHYHLLMSSTPDRESRVTEHDPCPTVTSPVTVSHPTPERESRVSPPSPPHTPPYPSTAREQSKNRPACSRASARATPAGSSSTSLILEAHRRAGLEPPTAANLRVYAKQVAELRQTASDEEILRRWLWMQANFKGRRDWGVLARQWADIGRRMGISAGDSSPPPRYIRPAALFEERDWESGLRGIAHIKATLSQLARAG